MSKLINKTWTNFRWRKSRDQDSKLKFSLDPQQGNNSSADSSRAGSFDSDANDEDASFGSDKKKQKRKESAAGFQEWQDAMRMVVRLPGGIPPEFRKKLWMTLSERYIKSKKINWNQTVRVCFNDKLNPDDDSIGEQIIKDLHRTGCSLFSGDDAEHNQALLKQVLLAYARWNKNVGYCQGFNILAAVILEVVEWDVEESLMVMIFLIEGLLPESYFANNLRGLSVDMAVFRDLMRIRLPILSKHLDQLQYSPSSSSGASSNDPAGSGVACYEPPLINVFTLQWFLTLFCNCLPKNLVLRIWDLIFLEGNEVLIRTALSIWDVLTERILAVKSADEFYSIMGVLTREMMEFGLSDTNELVKNICVMAPFPLPRLYELREKYTYNIRPLSNNHSFSFVKRGLSLFTSSEDEEDDNSITLPDDQLTVATWGLAEQYRDIRTPSPIMGSPGCGPDAQRMSLDVSLLKKQYSRLRERQKQAHVIITEGFKYAHNSAFNRNAKSAPPSTSVPINNLLAGKSALTTKKPRRTSSVQVPEAHRRDAASSKSSLSKSSSLGRKSSSASSSSKMAPGDKRSDKGKMKRSDNVHRSEEDDESDKESKDTKTDKQKMDAAEDQNKDKVSEPEKPKKLTVPKRAPYQPVIKPRSKIGRRASSIEPRDDGGETLSWSEIRKRRKASAPLIKVILRQDADAKSSEISDKDGDEDKNETPKNGTPKDVGSPKDEDGDKKKIVIKEISDEIMLTDKEKRLIEMINEDNNNLINNESSTEDEQDNDQDAADDEADNDDEDAEDDNAEDNVSVQSEELEILSDAKSGAASPDKLSVWTDMTSEADKSFGISSDTELCDTASDVRIKMDAEKVQLTDANNDQTRCDSHTTIERSDSSSPEVILSRSRSSPDDKGRTPQRKFIKSPETLKNLSDANHQLSVVHEDDADENVLSSENEDDQTMIKMAEESFADQRLDSVLSNKRDGLTPIEEEGPTLDGATCFVTAEDVQNVAEDEEDDAKDNEDAILIEAKDEVKKEMNIPMISVSEEEEEEKEESKDEVAKDEIDEDKIREDIKREVSELSIEEMIKRFSERLSSVNTD